MRSNQRRKNFGFSKKDRLRVREEFVRLSREGQKLHHPYFLALFSSGAGPSSRLGVTVTKKVGNAVLRNRIKRVVREAFRCRRQHIRGIWDINIIAKHQVAGRTTPQLFAALDNIFERL